MSGVREVRMEGLDLRSSAASGEVEASREVRWSARRKEPVVAQVVAGRVARLACARHGAAGRQDCWLAGGVPNGRP